MAFGSSCHAIEYPKNAPLIEALIQLHKDMKHAEDNARDNIAISLGEQSAVTKKTDDFHDVKTTLNTKLSNAYSYVLLAAALSGTANSSVHDDDSQRPEHHEGLDGREAEHDLPDQGQH